MNIKTILLITLVSFLLISCQTSQQQTNPEKQSESVNETKIQLKKLVEKYTKESFQFSPVSATFQGLREYNSQFSPIINQQNLNKQLAFQKKYLKEINAINSSNLSGQDLLTYKIFKSSREQDIQANSFPRHLVPINQMYGMHNFYAVLGSGESAQPFNNEEDYRNFIQRSIGFSKWMDSVIDAMKAGIKQQVVLPDSIVKKLIPQVKAHAVTDIKDSIFYQPLNNLPESLKGNSQLISDYETSIKNVIIPAYKKVHQFLLNEYTNYTRKSVGLSDLPNGKQWYEFMIKTHTTLPLTAEEIHQFGLSEVERILSEMNKVKQQVKFEGDMPDFFEFLRTDDQFYFDKPEQLIAAYQNVKSRIDATLPKLFDVFPKADYVVKAVPDFKAASSAGASYQSPAPDGSRPGIFYINTYNLKSQPKFLMETLSIHEAAPGHHFQIAIQQEVKGLPDFRKYGGYTVFNEGWALYAESLGKELGLFTDPYMWYGRLVDEQLRAMRLVVDTGLHAFGWSREKAIQYMLDNSSMARSDVEAEVERYIVIPGQALAYKIGQRSIRQLREKAEAQLGNKFDIKKFHTQILIDGSLPIPVLEDKINQWISTQK